MWFHYLWHIILHLRYQARRQSWRYLRAKVYQARPDAWRPADDHSPLPLAYHGHFFHHSFDFNSKAALISAHFRKRRKFGGRKKYN
jgi:hypothetical protein